MPTKAKHRAPVSIYVVWHHKCAAGPKLAEAIYNWFCTASGEVMPQKVGIPVHYRCYLSKKGELECPVAWGAADRNWVVLLIDEEMLIDSRWQQAAEVLRRKAKASPDNIRIFPVALHPSAGRLNSDLAKEQFVVPGPHGQPLEERRVALRRILTQAFAREVREMVHRDAPDSLRVFISHAKADGRDLADKCRTALYKYGQLEAFFDEHDLNWKSPWRDGLEKGVSSKSVALLVIETDTYASRPWCRRELELARQPRRLAARENAPWHRVWRLLPTVIASQPLNNWSKVIVELGNVPRIGWNEKELDLVFDKLLLEALLADTHALVAKSLAKRNSKAQIITWIPDLHSVLSLVRAANEKSFKNFLVYPGHGLTVRESKQIEDELPNNVKLKTFEEALQW